MQYPSAIVIKLDTTTGLQTSRILAGYGIPVIGIADNHNSYFCKTNTCQKIIASKTSGKELLQTLLDLGKTLDTKSVLIPCSDESVHTISLYRDKLKKWFNFILPEHDTIELLTEKERLYKYCIDNNHSIPPTFFPKQKSDLNDIAGVINYPCMLKPNRNDMKWLSLFGHKVIKINTQEQLYESIELCLNSGVTPILQDWVEGEESNIYQCYFYFDADQNPLYTYTSRKIRQWPVEIGEACLVEDNHNEMAIKEALKFYSTTRFTGLTSLEIKIDVKNGNNYIIEPDVSRPNTSIGLVEAVGVPILYTLYCDALNLPAKNSIRTKKKGIKWVCIRTYLFASWANHLQRRLTLLESLKSIYGVNSFAVLSLRDPAPFIFDMFDLFMYKFKRLPFIRRLY